MSADESVIGGLAGRYAVALFELTQELGEADQQMIIDNVADFKQLMDDSTDLQKLIKSPLISADEQSFALGSVLAAAGVHPLVKNFAALVVAKRRAFALSEMAGQFATLVASARDEMTAHITVARALSGAQIDALKAQLDEAFGKNVIVEAETNAELLGGMIVKVGSQMVDGSLRTKLNSLKTALSEG